MESTSSSVTSNVAKSNAKRPPPDTEPPSKAWNLRVAPDTVLVAAFVLAAMLRTPHTQACAHTLDRSHHLFERL
jgi:hypothetical protein